MPTRQPGLVGMVAEAPITSGMIALSIICSLYFWYGPEPGVIVMTPEAFANEPWRFVTSTLAHGNFIHLYFNLYWIRSFSVDLEARLHPLLYVALVVTIALGSGAAQFAVGVGGVGLSGVLYGLFGFLWFANSRADAFRDLLPASTIKLLIGWFFFAILITKMGFMNIGNTAHGVGGVMGWIAGWAVLSARETRPLKTIGYYGVLGLFLLAGSNWRMPLLSLLADEDYFAYVEARATFHDSDAFISEHDALNADVRGELSNEDWRAIRERATSILGRYDSPEDPPKAIARVLYIRAFASYRLEDYAAGLSDAERALRINPNEGGAAKTAADCRGLLRR